MDTFAVSGVTPRTTPSPQAGRPDDAAAARARAQLYHFFELALAHPGEEGLRYFRDPSTESACRLALTDAAAGRREHLDAARTAASAFFDALRALTDPEAESAHIALFSTNFPHLPCPPYGSLYTVDGDKRLDEMRAIKKFYEEHGVEIAGGFTDLPDHVCVELEFLQVLSFREHEAVAEGNPRLAAVVREAQARFLDRFLLPFAGRMALIAEQATAENPYSRLLKAADCFLRLHRHALDEAGEPST